MAAPLRTVLESAGTWSPGELYGFEPLACGHWVYLSSGWSYATRRRCKKCDSGAPQDFNPQAPRETWGNGLDRL